MDGTPFTLDLLDSGTQHFSSMRDLYINNSNGIVLVYSVLDQTSFVHISDIHGDIVSVRSEKGWDDVPIIIVGNKIDLAAERVVSKESGEELANQLGCAFLETSAKTPTNVTELFETCVKMCIQKGHIKPNIHTQETKGGCSLI
uniref:Uncharacterized protein n=1 Tax=Arcella intermedia TaxID=1963864 RepID=A0A6B2LKF3_9EUKA